MLGDPALSDYTVPSNGSSGYFSGDESPLQYSNDGIYTNKNPGSAPFDRNYTSPQSINIINEAYYRQDLSENNCFKDVPPLPFSSTDHGSKIGDNVPGFSTLARSANIPSAAITEHVNFGPPPDYFSFQNPYIFGDWEMTDLGNSSNELQDVDKNNNDNEFDDEFWKMLKELNDEMFQTEIESTKEVTQSFITYEYCEHYGYQNGIKLLIFNPKILEYPVADFNPVESGQIRLKANEEGKQLLSSGIIVNGELKDDRLWLYIKPKLNDPTYDVYPNTHSLNINKT
ncbi:hypothetical protein JTE90_027206 [Oedothorax gibbosus]|uniref:Uncharacterized protein n=1 Tax=Oedothorax gibbosus TaxID=931172 RepID=A0AAV6U637_9ARAC|nr:hypothetical protein JTE90_027206 [Oedothorax gibbosus]